jgi:hypothetical protein
MRKSGNDRVVAGEANSGRGTEKNRPFWISNINFKPSIFVKVQFFMQTLDFS